MFDFHSLKVIQIEITNRCQASCPMCVRNIHGGIENSNVVSNEWTLDDFKTIFDKEVIDQIDQIIFCGDAGDPIMHNDLISMCQHIKDLGPTKEIIINTNGSARSTSWWENLAKSLPDNHNVIFALDGLEDTHSMYRIGTNYNQIIKNSSAFIQAGGTAEWMFIRFKHNQHQTDEANRIANSLGFKKFTLKNSKRFGKKFPVLNKQGRVSYYLEPPSDSTVAEVTFVDLKDFKTWKRADQVRCSAVENRELYIDAQGHAMPCCFIGSFLYSNIDKELFKKFEIYDDTSIIDIIKETKDNVYYTIGQLGGFNALNVKSSGIKELMSTIAWQSTIKRKWEEKTSSPCIILCSKDSPYLRVEDQIVNRAS
jgi:MoaA/NifB/PqqE/SkfB family radical SAM enzyme